mmetsp:Transcript_30241/g.69817  ORF Transcript_30241/g.69817 Transcript_30241/m.69817 type:complete len:238 (+) Transcript_30241:503-1216(+)
MANAVEGREPSKPSLRVISTGPPGLLANKSWHSSMPSRLSSAAAFREASAASLQALCKAPRLSSLALAKDSAMRSSASFRSAAVLRARMTSPIQAFMQASRAANSSPLLAAVSWRREMFSTRASLRAAAAATIRASETSRFSSATSFVSELICSDVCIRTSWSCCCARLAASPEFSSTSPGRSRREARRDSTCRLHAENRGARQRSRCRCTASSAFRRPSTRKACASARAARSAVVE